MSDLTVDTHILHYTTFQSKIIKDRKILETMPIMTVNRFCCACMKQQNVPLRLYVKDLFISYRCLLLPFHKSNCKSGGHIIAVSGKTTACDCQRCCCLINILANSRNHVSIFANVVTILLTVLVGVYFSLWRLSDDDDIEDMLILLRIILLLQLLFNYLLKVYPTRCLQKKPPINQPVENSTKINCYEISLITNNRHIAKSSFFVM